ncbi:MAG: AAA family ATPase, partial [Methanomicrobiales archaeon]|nr:AAA family ATPase [Methanomicrobiales archaeon]
MPVKPIPYGIADYKSIITKGYAYVDKTMYIRSL